MISILVDNDIAAKAAAYNLLEELAAALSTDWTKIGVLGSVLYVISPKRLKAAVDGAKSAHNRLSASVALATTLEPNAEESKFATRLEQAAIECNLQFDVGESQLCAIAILRGVKLLCTGDKRAILALENLRTSIREIEQLDHKLVPLEALIKEVTHRFGYEYVRDSICASKGTDKAVELCFQCHNTIGDRTETETGLHSYLSALMREAPHICGGI